MPNKEKQPQLKAVDNEIGYFALPFACDMVYLYKKYRHERITCA